MGKVIQVENVETEQEENTASLEVPSIDDLQKLIDQQKAMKVQEFGQKLGLLMQEYGVELVPKVSVEGGKIIESAVIALLK